jgi:hypothetical protein
MAYAGRAVSTNMNCTLEQAAELIRELQQEQEQLIRHLEETNEELRQALATIRNLELLLKKRPSTQL